MVRKEHSGYDLLGLLKILASKKVELDSLCRDVLAMLDSGRGIE